MASDPLSTQFELIKNPKANRLHGIMTWCMRCERVWFTSHWVVRDWRCPRHDCEGRAEDAYPWSRKHIPRLTNPAYPSIPGEGGHYPHEPQGGEASADSSDRG